MATPGTPLELYGVLAEVLREAGQGPLIREVEDAPELVDASPTARLIALLDAVLFTLRERRALVPAIRARLTENGATPDLPLLFGERIVDDDVTSQYGQPELVTGAALNDLIGYLESLRAELG